MQWTAAVLASLISWHQQYLVGRDVVGYANPCI